MIAFDNNKQQDITGRIDDGSHIRLYAYWQRVSL